MGWNSGYTVLEAIVVGAYDLGVLDKALLTVILVPYQDTDVDSGGSRNLRTKDGKDVQEVIVEVMGGQLPLKPNQSEEEAPDAWDDYRDKLYGALFSLKDDQGKKFF